MDKLDLKALIKRKNEAGNYYVDGDNLLRQTRGNDDLFIDEATGEVTSKKEKEDYDTSKLDVIRIVPRFELCCTSSCPKCRGR